MVPTRAPRRQGRSPSRHQSDTPCSHSGGHVVRNTAPLRPSRLAGVQVAHSWLGGIAIGVCSVGALVGGILYWRGRGAGRVTAHVLSLAQTLLVAQVGLGLLLLAD